MRADGTIASSEGKTAIDRNEGWPRQKRNGTERFIPCTPGSRLNFLSDDAHHPCAQEDSDCSPSLDGDRPLLVFPPLVRVGNWDDVLDLPQRLR